MCALDAALKRRSSTATTQVRGKSRFLTGATRRFGMTIKRSSDGTTEVVPFPKKVK
jgi:hypothetical protein